MILISHIVVALIGLILTTYAWVRPSKQLLGAAYSVIGLTLASGIYLVWQAPSHMLEGCISGLLYVGVASVGIVAAHAKLARIQSSRELS